jgi:hypothetical protein
LSRGNDAKTPLPYLPPMVQPAPESSSSSDDLWGSTLREGVAPEEVRRVEQEKRRLFQDQLPAEEARRTDGSQGLPCTKSIPTQTTPRKSSRGDRGRTPCDHGVFGPTTLETFSRGDKGPSCCKDGINPQTTRSEVFKIRSTVKRKAGMRGDHDGRRDLSGDPPLGDR